MPRAAMNLRATPLALGLAGALVGCAPLVNLPQPSSPFSYREPPRPVEIPTPDPNGPCVQRISRRRRGTWIWKHDRLVDGGLTAATLDLPEANALANAAQRRQRALKPMFITAAILQLGFMAALAAVIAERPDDQSAIGLTLGAGFGLVWTTVGTAIALTVIGEHRADRAIALYNSWAQSHGCSDPPTSSSRR
jgi:hypothetical protein